MVTGPIRPLIFINLGGNLIEGLYDMAGNAWEICWDRFSEQTYTTAAVTNPYGPDTGNHLNP